MMFTTANALTMVEMCPLKKKKSVAGYCSREGLKDTVQVLKRV